MRAYQRILKNTSLCYSDDTMLAYRINVHIRAMLAYRTNVQYDNTTSLGTLALLVK